MKLSRLLVAFFVISSLSILYAGGKKTTIYTYVTESWMENDYFGSGFHFNWDKIKPNIKVEVTKSDGELIDTVGLPNNVQAGDSVKPITLYDRNLLASRVPSTGVATFNESSGKCESDGRCYGDWVNNEDSWEDAGAGKHLDSKGDSFLQLRYSGMGANDEHAAKKTRFRFTVFIEDNTPFWLRNDAGSYTGAEDPSTNVVYYFPLQRVVIRLGEWGQGSCSMAVPKDTDADSVFDTFDDRQSGDEAFIRFDADPTKDLKSFEINNDDTVPFEKRVIGGKHVFTNSFYHTFQEEKTYCMMVTAQDMGRNRRVLRFPIRIGKQKGVKIHDSSISTQHN
ncbi:MAG: hypothetical protein COB02_11920 [Candidatus Cloacimonadota bacterium]|nr:MAG: hypothetical protein COB02_11920 [Candidatus Cloacimonadota bacterium]